MEGTIMRMLLYLKKQAFGIVSVLLLAICFGFMVPQVAVGLDSVAEDSGTIEPRAHIDTVEDTYRVYLCHNNGAHNRSKYNVSYKSLRYSNGYSCTGSRLTNSWSVSGQCQYNHTGTVYIYQYTYSVW